MERKAGWLRRGVGRIADAWLPRACACCDAELEAHERGLCAHCERALPGVAAPRCACCAQPLRSPRAPRCAACARTAPGFDQTLALADYAPPMDRMVVALKFAGELPLARALAELAARRVPAEALEPPDLVTAVPLGHARLAQRGYNQALEIARPLARALGVPLAARVLHRVRETAAQATLDLPARAANLGAAFAASPEVHGRCVLVVDDVMTTGATLRAVADALRAAGARRVINLVAARTA